MEHKNKEPEDLGIKMGTKAQVLWEKVAKESRVLIEQSQDNLQIQTAMLDMALSKIAYEKQKV